MLGRGIDCSDDAVLKEVMGSDEESRTIDRDAYLDLVKDVFGIDLPALPPLTVA